MSTQLSARGTYDVFLAHSSADSPAVETLARKLRAAGIEPFFDRWHLVPGHPWQEGLEEALEASRTCAIFLGAGGLGPWQNEEMRAALDHRIRNPDFRLIPVLLPGAPDPAKRPLPGFLRRLTWLDFRAGVDDEDAYYRLLCGIRGQSPGASAGIAVAPRTPSPSPESPPDGSGGELVHVRELIEIHQKRQRVLETQAALKGIDTAPHVLIELEEVRERIDELEAKFRELNAAVAGGH